jgi:hypothetical protein
MTFLRAPEISGERKVVRSTPIYWGRSFLVGPITPSPLAGDGEGEGEQ